MVLKEEQRDDAENNARGWSMLTHDAVCSPCARTHISLPLLFPSELMLPGDPHYCASCQFPSTSLNRAGLPTELSVRMKLRIERGENSLLLVLHLCLKSCVRFLWWEQNVLFFFSFFFPLPLLTKHEEKSKAKRSLGIKHFSLPPAPPPPPHAWSHVSALSQYSRWKPSCGKLL